MAAAILLAGCAAGEAATSSTAGVPPSSTSLGTTTTAASTTAPTTSSSTTTSVPTTSTAPPTTTTTTPRPTTTLPVWWREVTAEAPLRVWVIGDSLAGPVGNALRARGGAAGTIQVTIDFRSSSGLLNPGFHDWPGRVEQRLGEVAPDVVVVVLGTNDGGGMTTPDGLLEFGTPEWDARYGERVGALADQLLAGCRRVYWVGTPIMAGVNLDARLRHINSILRAQATLRPTVAYVDAYTLFQDEAGLYASRLPDENGELVTVRQSDGVHYTTAGADRMARELLGVFAVDWGIEGG